MATDDVRRWQVHRFNFAQLTGDLTVLTSGFAPGLGVWAKALGVRDGQRFLLGPDGHPDLRVNAVLSSAK